MITFLLEEGVLTIGAISGLFTTALLNSLKVNIIDPSIENIIPSHKLDVLPPPTSPPPSPPSSPPSPPPSPPPPTKDKSNFASLFPIPIGSDTPNKSTKIKWQTFIKDLVTWIILMFLLYIFWKKVLHPIKIAKMVPKV